MQLGTEDETRGILVGEEVTWWGAGGYFLYFLKKVRF